MTKNYEPSKREIYTELWSGISKPLKEFGIFAGGIGGIVVLAPYTIPTILRNIRDAKSDVNFTLTQKISGFTGMFGGIAANIGQAVGYNYLLRHDHLEVLAIPIATNVGSGLYEVGRHMYRKARDRLVEKHREESLESVVSALQE